MGALASKLVQHPWSYTSLNERRLRSALHRGKYLTQANVSEFDLHDIILNHSLQLFSSLGKTKTNSAPPLSIPVLTCQPSTNAIGDGIFAGSRLLPGTVVAFFPGIAYLGVPYGKDDERPQPGWTHETWKENSYTMSLPDGGRIDGRAFLQKTDTRIKLIRNKLCVGHMINHPNKDDNPNVLAFPIVVDVDTVQDKTTIPSVLSESWYFSETVCALIPVPMEMRKMVPCVAIVVTKELKCGDELLLDYNLCEEVAKDEEWYVLRDAEADYENERVLGGGIVEVVS